MLDALSVTTLPIKPGLGPAPEYIGYMPWWLGLHKPRKLPLKCACVTVCIEQDHTLHDTGSTVSMMTPLIKRTGKWRLITELMPRS